MAHVIVDQASKRYGNAFAIEEVSLDIASGEFLTLLGPSGCGKSTTLRAVAGLVEIDSGTILLGGQDVTRMPIHNRDIGMVFQNLALFPHMTVAQNVAFGLRMRKVSRADQKTRVAAALDLVRLSGFADRYPSQLSGGQQQRVAIARALVIEPKVLLLDEPFAALDRKLREEMQEELRQLTRTVGITAMFVTHDQEEALTLSDRIAVMSNGRVEQIGAPTAIYERPETPFVADFMGARNIMAGPIERRGGELLIQCDGFACRANIPRNQLITQGGTVSVALRPERIAVERLGDQTASENAAIGTITSAVFQGAFQTLAVRLDRCDTELVVRQTRSGLAAGFIAAPGERARLTWSADDVIVLRDAPRDTHRHARVKNAALSPTSMPATALEGTT